MTKADWTVLFIRLVGLYLLVTHLATFATTTAGLIIAVSQASKGGPPQIYLWQAPVVSLLVLLTALFLITRAKIVGKMLEKSDKT